MEEKDFWKIIGAASKKAKGVPEEIPDHVATALKRLDAREIIAFDEVMTRLLDEAYRWDLWGAAYLMCGGCADDGFEHFRAWLISRGEAAYRSALEDPDSLASLVDPDGVAEYDCEELLYAASVAHEEKTGEDLPPSRGTRPKAPAGKRWSEDGVEAAYPKIAKAVGLDVDEDEDDEEDGEDGEDGEETTPGAAPASSPSRGSPP